MEMTNDDDDDEVASHVSLSLSLPPTFLPCPGRIQYPCCLEFQRWRLFCLAFGFVLLLLAPVVSSWVPFYYSSSMAVGVFLVIIILLFQGMKLLPTGRKNVFYLILYDRCSTITVGNSIYSANGNHWRSRGRANVRHNRAEFLSRSGMVASRGTLWNSPRRSSGWSDSPVKRYDISDHWEGDKKSTGLLFNMDTQQKEVFKKSVGEFHPGIDPICYG